MFAWYRRWYLFPWAIYAGPQADKGLEWREMSVNICRGEDGNFKIGKRIVSIRKSLTTCADSQFQLLYVSPVSCFESRPDYDHRFMTHGRRLPRLNLRRRIVFSRKSVFCILNLSIGRDALDEVRTWQSGTTGHWATDIPTLIVKNCKESGSFSDWLQVIIGVLQSFERRLSNLLKIRNLRGGGRRHTQLLLSPLETSEKRGFQRGCVHSRQINQFAGWLNLTVCEFYWKSPSCEQNVFYCEAENVSLWQVSNPLWMRSRCPARRQNYYKNPKLQIFREYFLVDGLIF